MNDKQILLIEDNPDDAFLTLRTLRKHGIEEVVVLADGAQALDYLFGRGEFADCDASSSPSFILLDLKLPKVDGIEFLEGMLADARTGSIPVIVMSSSQEERELEKCRSLGVRLYLEKPLNSGKLTKVLEEIAAYR